MNNDKPVEKQPTDKVQSEFLEKVVIRDKSSGKILRTIK